MGGYNPNPTPDSDAPASSKEEAEAIAGHDVGYRGTYGGDAGRAAQNYEIVKQNEKTRLAVQQQQQTPQQQSQQTQQQQGIVSGQEQNPFNPLLQAGAYSSWQREHPRAVAMPKQQAEYEYEHRDLSISEIVSGRSRYVPTLDFGDTATQEAVGPLTGEARFRAIGGVLESQRQGATRTPGIQDDMFYQNQLDLWNAQSIERSSGYHSWAKKTGEPQRANPFENEGDIALAIEKGGNQKENFGSNYAFNRNVGNVLQVLPQRVNSDGSLSPVGLQEYAWMGAVSRDTNGLPVGNVSFMPAIDYLNSQRDREGVYGDLWGGVKDTFTPLPSGFKNGGTLGSQPEPLESDVGMKRPFVSFLQQSGFLNPFVADAASGGEGGIQFDATSLRGGKFDFSKLRITQMSLTSSDITTSTPKSEFGGVIKANNWANNIPVFGGIVGIVPGLSEYMNNISPVPDKGTDGWSFDNVKRAWASNVMFTTEFGERRAVTDSDFNRSGEPHYTRMFIDPDTNKPSSVATIGEQTYDLKKSTIIPITGSKSTTFASDFAVSKRDFIEGTYGRISPEYAPSRNSPMWLDVAGGAYNEIRNNPDTIVGEFAVGAAVGWGFGTVGGIANSGISSAVKSGIPVISGAGRALSTPLATDMFTVGKVAIVGVYAVGVGSELYHAGSNVERGGILANTAASLSGFGVGYGKSWNPVVDNPSAGKTFFSKTNEFSPLQKLAMDTRAYITSFEIPVESRGAYRDVPKVFREVRNIQPRPGITETTPARPFTEPDISLAQTIGTKRAPAIREAMSETPHVVLGSVVMEGQRTGLPTGEKIRGFPNIHDLDVRANPEALDIALKSRGETSAGMDVKDFEPNYPMVAGRTPNTDGGEGVMRIGVLSRMFGEAIPNEPGMKLPRANEVLIGGKSYTGFINEEPMNVQFARKSQAFMQDMVPAKGKINNADARPIDEQFRMPKDFYDFQSSARDLIAGEQAFGMQSGKRVKVGDATPATRRLDKMDATAQNFEFLPKDDNPIIGAKAGVTFKKTMTLGEIRNNYESAILTARKSGGVIPKELLGRERPNRPYNPGAIRDVIDIASPSVKSVSGYGLSIAPSAALSIGSGTTRNFIVSSASLSGKSGMSSVSPGMTSPSSSVSKTSPSTKFVSPPARIPQSNSGSQKANPSQMQTPPKYKGTSDNPSSPGKPPSPGSQLPYYNPSLPSDPSGSPRSPSPDSPGSPQPDSTGSPSGDSPSGGSPPPSGGSTGYTPPGGILPYLPGGSAGQQFRGDVVTDKYLHNNLVAVMNKKPKKFKAFKSPRF